MPEWGLLIIQLLLIAGIGLFFWNFPFICALATVGFSVWLITMSFANYGDLSGGEYAIIEVRRFVCIFGVSSFAIEDVYKYKWRDENGTGYQIYFIFIPQTFLDAALKSLIVAASCLAIVDFLIPYLVGDGVLTTFRYGGILGFIFLVPAALLVIVEIVNLIKELKKR